MGRFLVVDIESAKIVQGFSSEMDAWCYIGELEHNKCVENPKLSYEDANKLVGRQYRIYGTVCEYGS